MKNRKINPCLSKGQPEHDSDLDRNEWIASPSPSPPPGPPNQWNIVRVGILSKLPPVAETPKFHVAGAPMRHYYGPQLPAGCHSTAEDGPKSPKIAHTLSMANAHGVDAAWHYKRHAPGPFLALSGPSLGILPPSSGHAGPFWPLFWAQMDQKNIIWPGLGHTKVLLTEWGQLQRGCSLVVASQNQDCTSVLCQAVDCDEKPFPYTHRNALWEFVHLILVHFGHKLATRILSH